MNRTHKYYVGSLPTYSPEYTAYRDRVVAGSGSIQSATACQRALDFIAANPPGLFDLYLDTRFGIKAGTWYSILGQSADVHNTPYANPISGFDSTTSRTVWSRGSFDGGITPLLAPADSYTFGMRLYQAGPNGATGYFFGNRNGDPDPGTTPYGSWWFVTQGFMQYRYYDAWDVAPVLPLDAWTWLWVVLDGAAGMVYVYDESNNLLASHARTDYWGRLPCGIGGGTLSDGVCGSELRYTNFLRARAALTAAQRAAIQAL